MEKIPSTMAVQNNVYGADTRLFTMVGPLVKNPLGKWLEVIIRGTYQSASEDSSLEYEHV